MADKIIFERDGIRVTERIINPVTGEREGERIVSYENFEKYADLKWLVKSIRPIIKNGVLTGLELEKDDISSQEKLAKSKNHKYDWYTPFVLEVIKEYAPIGRKEIVRRVFEKTQGELWDGDFARMKSGSLRWEVMVRWSVTHLKNQGKIYSYGRNNWKIK